MTRYLSLALFAEGPSDFDFLSRLLYRVTYNTAAKLADTAFEVSESFVRARKWPRRLQSREERIEAAFGQAVRDGAINVLFVHADGGRDPARAHAQLIQPCFERLERLTGGLSVQFARVGVIPVRETEAWALADQDALLVQLGARLTKDELSLPATPKGVEELTDAKRVLMEVIELAAGGKRRRRTDAGPVIPAGLAERMDLSKALQVPAFSDMAKDLESEIRKIWSIR